MIVVAMLTNLVRFVADPANAYWAHTLSYVTLCTASSALAIAIGVALGAVQRVT
jgi:hypothetical protein